MLNNAVRITIWSLLSIFSYASRRRNSCRTLWGIDRSICTGGDQSNIGYLGNWHPQPQGRFGAAQKATTRQSYSPLGTFLNTREWLPWRRQEELRATWARRDDGCVKSRHKSNRDRVCWSESTQHIQVQGSQPYKCITWVFLGVLRTGPVLSVTVFMPYPTWIHCRG